MTRPGRYEIGLHVRQDSGTGVAHLRIQRAVLEQPVAAGADRVVFRGVVADCGAGPSSHLAGRGRAAGQVLDAKVTWMGGN